jgi:hypothetical protein
MLSSFQIKKFESGGLIDTDALLRETKSDPRFYSKGTYTRAGKERLAAIEELKDVQSKGNRYQFNESGSEFKIVDGKGSESKTDEGRGVEVGKKIGPLYGVINKDKRSKKEVSTVLGDVFAGSKYVKSPDPTKDSKKEPESTTKTEPGKLAEASGMPNLDLTKKSAGADDKENIGSIEPGTKAPGKKVAASSSPDKSTPKVAELIASRESNKAAGSNATNSAGTATVSTTGVVAPTLPNPKMTEIGEGEQMFLDENFKNRLNPIYDIIKSMSDLKNSRIVDKGLESPIAKKEYLRYEKSLPIGSSYEELEANIQKIDNELKSRVLLKKPSEFKDKGEVDLVNDKNALVKKMNEHSRQNFDQKIQQLVGAIRIAKTKINDANYVNPDNKLLQISKLDELEKQYDGMHQTIMNDPYKSYKDIFKLLDENTAVTKHQYGNALQFDVLKWIAADKSADPDFVVPSFSSNNEVAINNLGAAPNRLESMEERDPSDSFRTQIIADEYFGRRAFKNKPPVVAASSDIKGTEQTITGKKNKLVPRDAGASNRKPGFFQRNGPILSSTGVNTPIGDVQYNDIVQFLLLNRAHKKPIAVVETPIIQDQYTKHGVRNVQAARDMDYGTLQDAERNIANMGRNDIQTADPLLEQIMKATISDAKTNKRAALIGERGRYRRQEEDRVNSELEERRLQAGDDAQREQEVWNRNNRVAKETKYKTDVARAEAETARDSAYYGGIGELSANIQTRWNNHAETRKQLAAEVEARDFNSKENQLMSKYQDLSQGKETARYMDSKFDEKAWDEKLKPIEDEINNHRKGRGNVVDDYDRLSKGRSLWQYK